MQTVTVVNSQYLNRPEFLQILNTGNGRLFNIKLLDVGINWHMWYKPMKLLSYVASLPTQELVLYCDALDVTLDAHPDKVEELYVKHFEGKVVFNCEKDAVRWTDKPFLEYKSHTLRENKDRPYINAGVFMGRADAMLTVLKKWVATLKQVPEFYNAGNSGCDQAPLVICWNNNPQLPIVLDSWERIMSVYPSNDEVLIKHTTDLQRVRRPRRYLKNVKRSTKDT